MHPDDPCGTPDLDFLEERTLTERQRTEAIRSLIDQGFSIADIWKMAPALLGEEPDRMEAISIPLLLG
jgi:hypothetical protein